MGPLMISHGTAYDPPLMIYHGTTYDLFPRQSMIYLRCTPQDFCHFMKDCHAMLGHGYARLGCSWSLSNELVKVEGQH
eukprot:5908632-Amphidinium_carterae.1